MKPARIVYDRGRGLPGHIVLRGQSSDQRLANMLTFELVALSKFIFGRGASANSIFNTGSGMLKFQSTPEVNKRRARLTTWAYRLVKSYDLDPLKLPVNTTAPMEDRESVSKALADQMIKANAVKHE